MVRADTMLLSACCLAWLKLNENNARFFSLQVLRFADLEKARFRVLSRLAIMFTAPFLESNTHADFL